MTLTSDDLQAIGKLLEPIKTKVESVATKQDLLPFATKQDLLPFATKQDLARFATKQDLARFATKEDIKKAFAVNNSVLGTIFKVELASTAKEIMKVMKIGFQEVASRFKSLDEKIEIHEKRINRLEEHTGLAKN